MSIFVPQQILETKPFQSAYGQLYSVRMAGLLDNQVESSVTLNVKEASNAPALNVPLDVIVGERNQYGVKIKKSPPPMPGQVPLVNPTSSTATPQQPQKLTFDRSSEREYIVRQSTLERATEYCIAKANFLATYGTAAQKKQAFTYLEGEKVLQVAHYYFKYCMGEVTIPTATVPVVEEVVVETPPSTPSDTPPWTDEDMQELPF